METSRITEHEHKYAYALIHTAGEIMRCEICGEPESGAIRLLVQTVIDDLRSNGPIRVAIETLMAVQP